MDWQLFVSLLKVPSFESGGLLNRLVSQTLKTKGQACYDTINGMYGNGVFVEVVEFMPLSNRLSMGLHLPPCQTPNLLDTLASAGNIDSLIGPHNHFFSISSCVASCTAKSKSESPELLQDIKMPFLTILAAPRKSSWVIEAEVRFFLNDAEGLMGPVNLKPVDISSTIATSSKLTLSNISRNRHNRLPWKNVCTMVRKRWFESLFSINSFNCSSHPPPHSSCSVCTYILIGCCSVVLQNCFESVRYSMNYILRMLSLHCMFQKFIRRPRDAHNTLHSMMVRCIFFFRWKAICPIA